MEKTLDSLSREIRYLYEDGRGHLTKIIDFFGREIVFTYDSNDNLETITSPKVQSTPNGNDFPNGKTFKFSYSEGSSDQKLNHNMTSITYPNEVAVVGNPRVVNLYDSDDRLSLQEWGGTNISGVSAGGNIGYSREEVNVGVDPSNPDLPREVVTVIDRNNNETVYSFNNQKNLIRKEEKTRGIRPGDPASFVTTCKYTSTGLIKEKILPLSNRIVMEYDENNPDQFQRGNMLSVTHFPDAVRGGDQQFLKVTYTYEPVYNQVLAVTEQRGNDPSFVPQNGGVASAERYTTQFIPDYFEGDLNAPIPFGRTLGQLVTKFSIDISSVQSRLNSGDLNEDGQFQACGNTVLVKSPTVNLRSDSPQAVVEGGTTQVIEQRMTFNKFGQMLTFETPEGEVTAYSYNPENDPDGDGQDVLTGNTHGGVPFEPNTGGYLKEVIFDQSHTSRYRNTAAPVQISNQYLYDRVGNRVALIDGRKIKHDFAVNQLNQVVQVTRAADVSASPETNLVAFSYKSRIFYDVNNNVVKTEVEFRDGNNPDLPSFIDSTISYDILDNALSITRLVSNSETITVESRYDANENLTEIRSPLAVAWLWRGYSHRIRQPSLLTKETYFSKSLALQAL